MWKKRLELFTVPWKKAGLIHDEGPDKDGGYGPYIQSERCKSGLYMEYAKQLIEKARHITASVIKNAWIL